MKNMNGEDKGMGIKGLILFFITFILIMVLTVSTVSYVLELISPAISSVGSLIAELSMYFIVIKKLKKNYNLNMKINYGTEVKVYAFIVLLWIGYRLTYDSSIGILAAYLSPNSWIHEAMKEELKFPMMFILGACVVAPIFEEIISRGYVLERLSKRYSKSTALILSALFFAILHMNLIQGPNAFFLGLILGAIYLWTNSLVPCMFLHLVNNTFSGLFYSSSFSIIRLILGIIILAVCSYIFLKDKKANKATFVELEV